MTDKPENKNPQNELSPVQTSLTNEIPTVRRDEFKGKTDNVSSSDFGPLSDDASSDAILRKSVRPSAESTEAVGPVKNAKLSESAIERPWTVSVDKPWVAGDPGLVLRSSEKRQSVDPKAKDESSAVVGSGPPKIESVSNTGFDAGQTLAVSRESPALQLPSQSLARRAGAGGDSLANSVRTAVDGTEPAKRFEVKTKSESPVDASTGVSNELAAPKNSVSSPAFAEHGDRSGSLHVANDDQLQRSSSDHAFTTTVRSKTDPQLAGASTREVVQPDKDAIASAPRVEIPTPSGGTNNITSVGERRQSITAQSNRVEPILARSGNSVQSPREGVSAQPGSESRVIGSNVQGEKPLVKDDNAGIKTGGAGGRDAKIELGTQIAGAQSAARTPVDKTSGSSDAKPTIGGTKTAPETATGSHSNSTSEGNKGPQTKIDTGKAPGLTPLNEGIKNPPAAAAGNDASKGPKVSVSDGTAPPGSVAAGPKSPISAPLGDGAKTPGKAPQSASGLIEPNHPDGNRPLDTGKATSSSGGDKGVSPQSGSKNDVASGTRTAGNDTKTAGNDIRTGKAPVAGTETGGTRGPLDQRIDPRAGKEKASPQADPGTHVADGRTSKGEREAEPGTKSPVKRGDVREPSEPVGRADKAVRADSNNISDKVPPRATADSGGKVKAGESNTPYGGRRNPNAISDKTPPGAKSSSGVKEEPPSKGSDTFGIKTGTTGKLPNGPKDSSPQGSKASDAGKTATTDSGPRLPAGSSEAAGQKPSYGIKDFVAGQQRTDAVKHGISDASEKGPSGVKDGGGAEPRISSGAKDARPGADQKGSLGVGGGKLGVDQKGSSGVRDGLPGADQKGSSGVRDGLPGADQKGLSGVREGLPGADQKGLSGVREGLPGADQKGSSGVREGLRGADQKGSTSVGTGKPGVDPKGSFGAKDGFPASDQKGAFGVKDAALVADPKGSFKVKDGSEQKDSSAVKDGIRTDQKNSPAIKDGMPGVEQKSSFGVKGSTPLIGPRVSDGGKPQIAGDGMRTGRGPSAADIPGRVPTGKDVAAKPEPAKIESLKPDRAQPKSPQIPIERDDPSLAKIQRDNPRGIANGAKGELAPYPRPDRPANRQPIGRADATHVADIGKLSKAERMPTSSKDNRVPPTLKLVLGQRQPSGPTAKNANAAVEQTIVLTVSKRLPGGVLEVPVSRNAVDVIRISPRIELDASKVNSKLGKPDAGLPNQHVLENKTLAKQKGLELDASKVNEKLGKPDADLPNQHVLETKISAKQKGLDLDVSKVNSKVGKLDEESRNTLVGETKTFAKHSPDGTGMNVPQSGVRKIEPDARTSDGGKERVDKLFPKTRKESTKSDDMPSNTVPHSIREVFLKFQLALPKRTFRPEITDSGSYVAQRGQSSERLDAFISSGQHKALRPESEFEKANFDRRHLSASSTDDIEEHEKDECGSTAIQQLNNSDRLAFAKSASPANHEYQASARKLYIVQPGDTPRSIAVVQLNDHLLEELVVEINNLLFQKVYDPAQAMHIKVLPVGAMILLPNKQDIAAYRERTL